MSLESMLLEAGHDVAIFSMDYPLNEESRWSIYWPSNMSKIKAFSRPFGDSEVTKKFNRLLDDFKPDVVHLNNIHTQLSPVLAKISHERGIKVVWTLHDSKLVCPCYTCMRGGKWCQDCFESKMSVIRHKCMPGSYIGSTIGYLEARHWNSTNLQEYTNTFISPSQFLANVCVSGGFNRDKFNVLCNFIDLERVKSPSFNKEEYYIFLGRLTEVKGIKTLCRAADALPYKLIVVGDGDLQDILRKEYSSNPHIEFKGKLDWNQIRPLLERAKFMVIPSEWSENNPLSVIESLSLGTPVLGARIGGIPELIEESVSGMTFISGDQKDLEAQINKMWTHEFNYKMISEQSQKRFGSEAYYEKLMNIYKD